MILRIKELRIASGMRQVDLAAQVGVSQSTLAGWEAEVNLPKTRDLPRLARVLGVHIDELFEPDYLSAS